MVLTIQPLVTPPNRERLPETYENLLLDPMVTLSDTCAGLLERQPVRPGSRKSRRASGNDARPAYPISHAAAAGVPHDRYDVRDEGIGPVLEPYAVEQSIPETESIYGSFPGNTSFPSEISAAIPRSAPTRRSGGQVPQAVTSPAGREGGPRPGTGVPSMPAAESTPEQVSDPDVYDPVEGLSVTSESEEPLSPGTRDEAQQFVARPRTDGGRTEPSFAVLGGSVADGPAWEDPEASPPGGGVRLATGASRLAAMMREGAALDPSLSFPGGRTRFDGTPEESESPGAQPVEEPVEEPDRSRRRNPVGVEEVMEQLADELETEFVRTYGSSGGQAWL